jgi:hypothetical protein
MVSLWVLQLSSGILKRYGLRGFKALLSHLMGTHIVCHSHRVYAGMVMQKRKVAFKSRKRALKVVLGFCAYKIIREVTRNGKTQKD